MIKGYKMLWSLNSDIKDGLKKFSIFFCQAEMVFVIVWFLDQFALEYVPSMNSIWIITPASVLHVWITKFKTFLIFFKLSILTSNNVIWVGLFAILFDKAQHVVKISTTGYVPVFYEVINLFIKLQNFQLMFIICKLEGLYLIILFFNDLLMFFLYFVCSCCRTWGNNTLQQCFLNAFAFGCWLESNSSYMPSSLI